MTKHLRVLQGARIVRSVRAGRKKLFELDPAPIKQVGNYADAVSKQWDQALGRLRAFVEREQKADSFKPLVVAGGLY